MHFFSLSTSGCQGSGTKCFPILGSFLRIDCFLNFSSLTDFDFLPFRKCMLNNSWLRGSQSKWCWDGYPAVGNYTCFAPFAALVVQTGAAHHTLVRTTDAAQTVPLRGLRISDPHSPSHSLTVHPGTGMFSSLAATPSNNDKTTSTTTATNSLPHRRRRSAPYG